MNYIDPTGHWLFQVLAGVANGIMRAVGKIISNVTSGRPIFEHTIGAFTGGFVEGAVYAQTFNPAAASYAGAAVESVTNEAEDYVVGRKELNWDNVKKSILNIGKDTALEGTAGYALGRTKIGGDVYTHLNKGMFKPKTVKAFFKGKLGQKTMINQVHSNILSTTIDTGRNRFVDAVEKIEPKSTKKRSSNTSKNTSQAYGTRSRSAASKSKEQQVYNAMQSLVNKLGVR